MYCRFRALFDRTHVRRTSYLASPPSVIVLDPAYAKKGVNVRWPLTVRINFEHFFN